MEEFSAGDLVRIKDRDFLEKHKNESPTINSHMMNAAGTLAVINYIDGRIAHLCECIPSAIGWSWKTDWLEYADGPACSEEAFDSMLSDEW